MFNFVQNYRVIFIRWWIRKEILAYTWIKVMPYMFPLKLSLLSLLMIVHDLEPCNLKFSISINIVLNYCVLCFGLQVSNLCQVVELLRCKGIEPVVRRSAVTQISVMLEDSNLHDQFLKQDGLNMILDILHKALVSCLLTWKLWEEVTK
jgi:hypothetical protein